jgi:transcriptional regulator with XRE-family HTH domain
MNYEGFKNICKKRGTSATAVIAELGLTTANTGSWKNGGDPSAKVLKQLSERLDVTTDYLLGLTDKPTLDLSNMTLKDIEKFQDNINKKMKKLASEIQAGYGIVSNESKYDMRELMSEISILATGNELNDTPAPAGDFNEKEIELIRKYRLIPNPDKIFVDGALNLAYDKYMNGTKAKNAESA